MDFIIWNAKFRKNYRCQGEDDLEVHTWKEIKYRQRTKLLGKMKNATERSGRV